MFILFEEKRENKEYKGTQQVRWDQQADEGGWGQKGNNQREYVFALQQHPQSSNGRRKAPSRHSTSVLNCSLCPRNWQSPFRSYNGNTMIFVWIFLCQWSKETHVAMLHSSWRTRTLCRWWLAVQQGQRRPEEIAFLFVNESFLPNLWLKIPGMVTELKTWRKNPKFTS